MKTVVCIVTLLLLLTGSFSTALAASGKCTVVEVQGQRMIIECDQRTKGFSQGSKIKIKTDRKKAVEGC